MVRSAELSAREARIAELKQLITSRHYDSLEKLEEAVEAFLWGEEEAEAPALALPVGPISAGTASRAFRGPLNPR
jgi:hypothetical protein